MSALPLKAIAVFDAVMQHQSFAIAAQQLHVTPGAVGQQIQKLEAWLGAPLFVRTVRQIEPTAEAQQLWAEVQPALARIQQASELLRLRQSSEVWLSMPPVLAAKWFAPRMAAFLQARPDVSLHLSASADVVDFDRDRVDLAIRRFDGKAPQLEVDLLYPDEARMYCAPSYAHKLGLHAAGDVARATLLHNTLLPYWGEWLARYTTLTPAQTKAIPGLHFDQSMTAIEAAVHGQGVVLSHAISVQAELREGSLCEPLPLRMAIDKGYYLVHSKRLPLRPAAQALKDWLLQQVALERSAEKAV